MMPTIDDLIQERCHVSKKYHQKQMEWFLSERESVGQEADALFLQIQELNAQIRQYRKENPASKPDRVKWWSRTRC